MTINTNAVVVTRLNNKFNFELMQDSEMCDLLEQLIEEINRRKAGTVDVGNKSKPTIIHNGIKSAALTVIVKGK